MGHYCFANIKNIMNIRRDKRDVRGASNLPYKTLYDPSATSKDKRWMNFLRMTKRDT